MKQFLMQNKVFLSGLAASIVVVLQQFIGQNAIDLKVLGFAVLMAVLSYIGNQWRGQGFTITGIVGTLAITFGQVANEGKINWLQFGILSIVAILSAAAPPAKSVDYEKTNVIANAKQGISDTKPVVQNENADKPLESGK